MNDVKLRPPAAFPAGLLDVRPPRFLRRSGGRETFAWEVGGSKVVVKRTLGAGKTRPSGRREFAVLEALRADGLPVPLPITWAVERAGLLGLGSRSLVVLEHVSHRETLRELAARADARERRIAAMALLDVVVRLHERGWHHRDLYLQHFLVPWPRVEGGPELVMIDVGRARRGRNVRRRWFVKDLAALACSCPARVGPREKLRFLAGYLDRRGVRDRAERRSWARAVVAKAERLSSHVPKDERAGV